MRRIRRLLAFAAATAALPLVAAAPAGAALRWAEPETLGAGFPGEVAIDARGDVLAVWQLGTDGQNLRTFYAWRPPRGDWTARRELDAPARFALALSPLGRAAIAWNDGHGRIVAAEARPGGPFGSERTIVSGVKFADVDIEVDDAGNAVAAGGGPFIATNAAGATAVGWMTVVGGLPELAYRPPAGSFGPPERSPLSGPTFPLHMAVDDTGRAVLAAG